MCTFLLRPFAALAVLALASALVSGTTVALHEVVVEASDDAADRIEASDDAVGFSQVVFVF
jgi:hypothetical protein